MPEQQSHVIRGKRRFWSHYAYLLVYRMLPFIPTCISYFSENKSPQNQKKNIFVLNLSLPACIEASSYTQVINYLELNV